MCLAVCDFKMLGQCLCLWGTPFEPVYALDTTTTIWRRPFYLLSSGFQRCLLSSTLVSAGWCVVLPGMSISLLIIVGCECAPGQLVCIIPVQLAAKLQSGLIVSMRFRSDRSCHFFWGGGKDAQSLLIYTPAVSLGFTRAWWK